jgi:hypothetical protein
VRLICLTLAIVLGPTGNLQGTYKLFNMLTGRKIKQWKLTAYPMPESIIKKVEQFGKSNQFLPAEMEFSSSGMTGKYPEGLVKEGVVLYPSLVAETPRVVLE